MKANGLYRRLLELERAAETHEPDNSSAVALANLCSDVLAAMAAGYIVNSEYGDSGKVFEGKPTSAAGLSEDDQHKIHVLLYRIEQVVTWWAQATGWRSPSAKSWQTWQKWQAKNCEEMAAVLRDVLAVLESMGIFPDIVPTYTPHEEPADIRLYGRWETYQRGIRKQFKLGEFATT